MKKYTILMLALLAMFAFNSSVFAGAADNEDDPGSTMIVSDQDATDPQTLAFNFSPSVCGTYITAADTGNEQAFTIGTYHSGGELFYATASDQTSVYSKERTTVQTFADAGFPATDADGVAIGDESPWETDTTWTK